jgi:hypothetical protein
MQLYTEQPLSLATVGRRPRVHSDTNHDSYFISLYIAGNPTYSRPAHVECLVKTSNIKENLEELRNLDHIL